MSGSSGGGGFRGQDVEIACEVLGFEAQITSPQPAVVANLEPGEVLDIIVARMRDQVVVQVHRAGELVGGLTGPDAGRLRSCVNEGHRYNATVIRVNAGQVRVRVDHAR